MFISVKNTHGQDQPVWAAAVEKCLHGILHSYACNNFQDRAVLVEIFKRVIPQGQRVPNIIVTNFQPNPYDISGALPQVGQFLPLIEAIEVTDVVVRNILIDQRAVEHVVLAEDVAFLRDTFLKGAPRNVKEGFAPNADQYYPAPSFRTYPAKNYQARYLSGSIDGLIKSAQAEYGRLNGQLNEANAVVEGIERELAGLERQRMESAQLVHEKKTQRGEIMRQRTAIDRKIEDAQSKNLDVNVQQQEVLRVDQELASLSIDLITTRRDGKRAEKTAADSLLEEWAKNMRELMDEKQKLQQDIEDTRDVQTRKRQEKVAWKEKLVEYTKETERSETDLDEAEKALKVAMQDLMQTHGQRIKSNLEKQKLMEKIARHIKRLNQEDKECGDRHEVEAKYRESQARYAKATSGLDRFKRLHQQLLKGTKNRENNRYYLRDYVAGKIGEIFAELLDTRNFEGSLIFDHHKEQLRIEVRKSPSSESSSASDGRVIRDLKSLSGGERSFLTVSLVLAVWEAMDTPFRCMDEFDVFMDMVNRRLAFDLLVDFAVERNRHHQFIFLTPQDLGSYVQQFDKVNIRQLADPRPTSGGDE